MNGRPGDLRRRKKHDSGGICRESFRNGRGSVEDPGLSDLRGRDHGHRGIALSRGVSGFVVK